MLRDLLALLLGVIAVAALTAWAPAAWVRDAVVDRAGFLRIAQPIGADSSFRRSIADSATTAVVDDPHVPSWARSVVEPVVKDEARKLVDRPVFSDAWTSAMSQLHGILLDPRGGTVHVDATGMITEALRPVQDRVPFPLMPQGFRADVPILTLGPSPWSPYVVQVAQAATWLPWAGGGAAVLALVVAGHRRGITAVLGALAIVAGGGLWFGAGQVPALVPDSLDRAPIVGRVVQAFEGAFNAGMAQPSALLAGGGAVLIVLAVVAGAVRRA